MPEFDIDAALMPGPEIEWLETLPVDAQLAVMRIANAVQAHCGGPVTGGAKDASSPQLHEWQCYVFLRWPPVGLQQGGPLEADFNALEAEIRQKARPCLVRNLGFNDGRLSCYCAGI